MAVTSDEKKVINIEAALDKAEKGTAIDHERIFRSFENGEVFELEDKPSTRQILHMLARDSQARQLASALKLPVRASKWDIIAQEGGEKEAEFIRWCFSAPKANGGMKVPFRLFLSRMANAIITGQAHFEKRFKRIKNGEYKGKIGLDTLAYRPPTTCSLLLDKNGNFDGFLQRGYMGRSGKEYTDKVFKPHESFVYIHNSDESPTGATPFEVVYYNYLNKLKVQFFFYAFLENVAFPKTIVRLAGDDEDELRALLEKARKFGARGIMALTDDETVEPYEAKRSSTEYQDALEYIDWQMARACLAQFLDLGTSGERGSYALSRDKSSFFFNALEATLDEMASHINEYIIADLVRVNFGPEAKVPQIRFRRIADDLAEKALDMFRDIAMAQTPNVTPPFMLQLMRRISEILELNLDPLEDFDENAMEEVAKTIPTPREQMESREDRAGSGFNPITGKDRNENNKSGVLQGKGAKDQLQGGRVGKDRPDNTDITNQVRSPSPRGNIKVMRRRQR